MKDEENVCFLEDLQVLANYEECQHLARMLPDYLKKQVHQQFEKRRAFLKSLKTDEDWQRHAEHIRTTMAKWVGPFPERTPLNPQITGKVIHKGYIIEKVILESRPHFYITANLYSPTIKSGPYPGVFSPVGHFAEGKATDAVQRRCISLVEKGYVVLTYDFVGQGERADVEYNSPGPSGLHKTVGYQASLVGYHLFNIMAWDAIRCLDYLCSRQEVDAARIGCTGCSGGAMMTSYLLPLESRISIAVPACNVCTWEARVMANLATDDEQVFFGAFQTGIDPRGDFLFTFAPKPVLVNATTRDSLNPPEGVWEVARWLYQEYMAFGVLEKMQAVMCEGPHGYNKEQRQAMYGWINRWSGRKKESYLEPKISIEKTELLNCTKNGNVKELGGKSPHDLVREYLDKHHTISSLLTPKEPANLIKKNIIRNFIQCTNFRMPSIPESPSIVKRVTRNNCTVEQFVLKSDLGIYLPSVLLKPLHISKRMPVILYLNSQGKKAFIDDSSTVNVLLKQGISLCAVDLRGRGETVSFIPNIENTFWDFLLGKPLFAQRVEDACQVVKYLHTRDDVNLRQIWIWGKNTGALVALHLALLQKEIAGIVMEDTLASYKLLVDHKLPQYGRDIMIPGILQHYDLPDAMAALTPMQLLVLGPLDYRGNPLTQSDAIEVFRPVEQNYRARECLGHFTLIVKASIDQKYKKIIQIVVHSDN